MNFTQNEFIHLINSYYQAEAYSKNAVSSGLFGEFSMQNELSQFRENIKNNFTPLNEIIENAEQNGAKGEVEKMIMKSKLTEIYEVQDWFTTDIENSVNSFLQKENGDMTSYRLTFQMASDYIYDFVSGTIKNFGDHVPLKDGIYGIITSILNENYWEGEELKQQINFIRNLKNSLNFTEEWIKEYAYKMFII